MKNRRHSRRSLFYGKIVLVLCLAEHLLQHGLDWCRQQGFGLLAKPNDVCAAGLDRVGIDELALVVVYVEPDFDAVGSE